MYSSVDGRRRLGWALVPVLVVAAFVATAIGASLYFGGGPVQGYGWWPWAPFGWFFFIPLLFAAFFVLRFFFWGWWGGPRYYGEDSAMQVLRERFARGEITREQLEQMRKDLQG